VKGHEIPFFFLKTPLCIILDEGISLLNNNILTTVKLFQI